MAGSGPISIVDSERGPTIVTPELRLSFCRDEDRWCHLIEVRPCERSSDRWPCLAEPAGSFSWPGEPGYIVNPVYQDIQVRRDGAAVLVLAVGQAGTHHFSAAIQVTHHWLRPNAHDMHLSTSTLEFDVADRCRSPVFALESHYSVYTPPSILSLPPGEDGYPVSGWDRWRDALLWKLDLRRSNEAGAWGREAGEGASQVALTSPSYSGFFGLRFAPRVLAPTGTNRLCYKWTHARLLPRCEAFGSPYLESE
jgi:hypothetical protein